MRTFSFLFLCLLWFAPPSANAYLTPIGPAGGITGVESYTGMIPAAADGTYTIDLSAAFSGTINTFKVITDSGTATAAVKINGTNVTGISAVSVSSVIATGTASAANAFAIGDKITLVLSSSSSPVNLAFTLKYTR